MAYSTISEKYGLCIDCNDNILKPIIADRCKAYHYKHYGAKKMLETQKEKSKFRSLINTPTNKSMVVKSGKVVDNELELFFLMRMNTCEPVCENCGARKDFLKEDGYKKLWRSCQAHLLPKRHFKSISHHPLNGMVLGSGYSGLCHCHDIYDSSWSAASKMDIWPIVVERFKILYPLLAEKEHQYIPQILLYTL